jgi:hypothetical protein
MAGAGSRDQSFRAVARSARGPEAGGTTFGGRATRLGLVDVVRGAEGGFEAVDLVRR